MASTSNQSDSPQNNRDNEENYGNADQSKMLACNICLEIAIDAVVIVCGHLYCWPCLLRWLVSQRGDNICPVCKFGISKDTLIPINRCGIYKHEDPRNRVSPSLVGQTTETDATVRYQQPNLGFFDFNFVCARLLFYISILNLIAWIGFLRETFG